MNVRVKLIFPEQLVREPIIAKMVRDFNIEPNIRRASVEDNYGWIILELVGNAADIDSAIAWLDTVGITVELIDGGLES